MIIAACQVIEGEFSLLIFVKKAFSANCEKEVDINYYAVVKYVYKTNA